MENIWLFGASAKGKEAVSQLSDHYHICGFIDNDPKKHGQTFLSLPVISFASYIAKQGTSSIAICSQYVFEIMQQLLTAGIRHFYVFEYAAGTQESKATLVPCDFPNGQVLEPESLSLFVHNSSGSNTQALSKLGKFPQEWIVKTAIEGQGDANWYETYMNSCNFVCTHDLVVPEGRNSFQLWHGFPLKGLNYMSRYQSHKHRQTHQQYWARYKGIASYSATYTSLMNACFGGSIEQYQITGMPRNDFLFASDGRTLFESITGRSLQDRNLIAYMPTFRKTRFGQINGDAHHTLFGFDDFDMEHLIAYLDQNRITMIVKPHPYEVYDQQTWETISNSHVFCLISDEFLHANKIDFYEILNGVDLLITDYSSVYFDYLLLDRPIVFTPTDAGQYENTRGFLLEPYDFWAPGTKCLATHQLFHAIEHGLSHPDSYAAERDRVTSIVHHYRDGKACARVIKMLTETLKP